ncbi:hypothetical protein HWV07_17115 [Natronomonas salina]|uniref:CARDB domain-containing protein n=1 Tax=Natronomonas salina TaxID=1710540 RepID=UPI0015B6958C|nr:CARDB domain-containing protein [Natronomonas salina]QLD90668.1 hypothetical protein HWV07_17115 [Natronomonas salina]
MGKFSVFSLVVLVLVAGAAVPGAALQGGPPDHAGGGDGGGPPDHANGGDADDDDAEADGDDDAGEEEAGDEADDGPPDHANAAEEGGSESADSDSDDATTDADSDERDGESSPEGGSDSDDGPSDVVDSVLEPLDPSEDPTPETPEATPDTPSSQDDRERFPFPEETETSTPEAESEPTGTPGFPSNQSVDSTPTPDDGGASTPATTPTSSGVADPGPSVDVETGENETVASVSGVDDGENVSIDLRGPATDGRTVGVEAIDVGVGDGQAFDIGVTRPTANATDEPVSGVSLAYFDVETDLDDVERATLTLEVDADALPSDVAPEAVQVLRYHDGEWTSAETSTDGTASDAATVTAVTPGFSTFAVALPERRPLQVTDAEVPADQVRAGHEPTARATVANPSERRATESVSVSVDGETVETREVTLDGGESTTVEFELPAQAAGERSVAVEGVEAGQLQVRGADTATPAAAEESRLDVGFGIAAATFVVLAAAGTGLLASRRENWDWRR